MSNKNDFMKGMNIPQVDVSRLIDSYKKNLDSMNQAVGLASETLKTIGQLQSKYFSDSLNELGEVMETMKEGQPKDKFIKAGIAAKETLNKALEHSTQVGQILAKAGKSASQMGLRQASDIVYDADKKPR